jgi:hypothetical protein
LISFGQSRSSPFTIPSTFFLLALALPVTTQREAALQFSGGKWWNDLDRPKEIFPTIVVLFHISLYDALYVLPHFSLTMINEHPKPKYIFTFLVFVTTF